MKKMTLQHSEAVSAAKMSLTQLLERDTAPAFKEYINHQLALMSDVYWWILDTIYTPKLPFDGGEKPEEHDGI